MKQSKDFYLGYKSYAYGQTNNPYDEGTGQYEEWQQGFDAAEDDEAALEHTRKYARRSVQRGYVSSDPE
jgi:hypothetical protein